MTPQHLHAVANLWSLAAIWPNLLQAAERAAGATGDDRGTVQAWRPGSGVHSGRTADQILNAILREQAPDANPYEERALRTGRTMAWLITSLGGSGAGNTTDHIGALRAAAPGMLPNNAINVAMWAGAEDRQIRQLLREPDDRLAVPVIACPRCDTAGALAFRLSNPDPPHRPVVCTQPSCHMAGAIPSIWTRTQLEEALACSPPQTAPDGAQQQSSPTTSA